MPNRRREIRKIIVDKLLNKTAANDRVFDFRIRAVQNENLMPCINCIIREEKVFEMTSNQQLLRREAEIKLTISALLAQDENNIDDICVQVEKIMNSINSNDFLFKLHDTEYFYDSLTTRIMIACTMTYICEYYTEEINEIILDDLEDISIGVVNHG